MARGPAKKQPNTANKSIHAQVTAPSTSSSIPEPFVLAPAQLRPLFSTLPTDHVYAIHIDNTSVELKKRVYVVPVLLNLVIVMLLCVRIYFAAPVYLEQMITIFGYETSYKVEPSGMGYGDIMGTIANRTGLLMIDYAIFGFIGSWPWEFLFGSKYSRHTGSLGWRRAIGFQKVEILVRKGRKWDTALFSEDNKKWTREDELAIMVKVNPAMSRSYTSKTGYLLLDKDWDLDFKGMIDAHRLVEKGRIELKDLDHIVLVHYQKQWLLWRISESPGTVAADAQEDETIREFRKKLASLGCEDVFFRWIEIVQYESSQPSGFTASKKAEAMDELKRLLETRKKDFTRFLEDVGGRGRIPGLA